MEENNNVMQKLNIKGSASGLNNNFSFTDFLTKI